jgi:hypothetical protein
MIPGITQAKDYFTFQRTDPTRKPAEPPAKDMTELDRAAVLRRYNWTDADLDVAAGLGEPIAFPAAEKRWRPGRFGRDLIWRGWQLDRWDTAVRERIAALQRLIGQRAK